MGGGQRNSLVARALGCLNSVIKKPNDELEVLRVERGVVSEATLNKCCQNSYVKNYTLHTTPSKLKCAFTLAEVLITLGVIGVVAALTLPTVIGNYQKQATVSKLKKVYTTLNQAIKSSEADNGEYRNWASVSDIGGDAYFDQYWKPYLTKAKICRTYQECGYSSNTPWMQLTGAFKPAVIYNARLPIILPDGTLIVIVTLSGTVEGSDILVDLNAGNPPNIYCKDFFRFYRDVNGQIYPAGYKGSKIITAGDNCSWVIMSNGWKIPDDYPW